MRSRGNGMDQTECLQRIAGAIELALNDPDKAPTVGFFLIVFDFNRPGISHYVSNGERASCIEAMKELIERWEADDKGVA